MLPLLEYNVNPDGEDQLFSFGAFIVRFYRADLFGAAEEDVALHDVPAFLTNEPSADVVTYIRYGTPKAQIVKRLEALQRRAEEGVDSSPVIVGSRSL